MAPSPHHPRAVRWAAVALAALLVTTAHAQQTSAETCYYPDGKTISTTDIPCNTSAAASSCCRSDEFCLYGGLCFGGGLVTRGSCTDKTWRSDNCAEVCTTVSVDSDVAISPCTASTEEGSPNTFVCGVNNTNCQTGDNSFVMDFDTLFMLRPAQVAALVEPALAAQPAPTGIFSTGDLAGVALGIAIPCLAAIIVLIFLLRRERRRPARKIKLPSAYTDEKYTFHPDTHPSPMLSTEDLPIPLHESQLTNPSLISIGDHHSRASSVQASSLRTNATDAPRTRSHSHVHVANNGAPGPSFAERYGTMKLRLQAREEEMEQRHELESTPADSIRYELGEKRLS